MKVSGHLQDPAALTPRKKLPPTHTHCIEHYASSKADEDVVNFNEGVRRRQ
jgi:hypothetical protein